MASETGTATNMEDLLTRIITFVTTNTALTSASPSQAWTVLRQRRDNLLSMTSTFINDTGLPERMMRQDMRFYNNSSITSSANYYRSANTAAGNNITMRLRSTRDVVTVRLKAPPVQLNQMVSDFRLQYSDDGSNWTTCLTVTGESTWSSLEESDYTFTSVGTHEYWRFIVDQTAEANVALYMSALILIDVNGDYANQWGSEVIFRAPGLAGTDNIYTGIRTQYDAGAGYYNFFLMGYQGYQAAASVYEQPGTMLSMAAPMVPLWDDSITYWFYGTGRAFCGGFKVSTNFEGMYIGFMNQYAAPSQYPYPLVIGGSMHASSADFRYSASLQAHSVFVGPATASQPETSADINSSLYVLDSAGNWQWFGNRRTESQITSTNGIQPMSSNGVHPSYDPTGTYRAVWPHINFGSVSNENKYPYRECLGGGYLPEKVVLLQRLPSQQPLGEFDGVLSISGFGNSAEDTTTVGSDNYVILQNAFRTNAWEYWAIKQD